MQAAERHVRLQLSWIVFVWFNKFGLISRIERCSIQSVINVVSANKTRFSPEGFPIICKAHVGFWTPFR